MNLLKNTTPFGLLSKECQQIMSNYPITEYVVWNYTLYGGGSFVEILAEDCEFNPDKVYRLRLKVGKWYRVTHPNGRVADVQFSLDDKGGPTFYSPNNHDCFVGTDIIDEIVPILANDVTLGQSIVLPIKWVGGNAIILCGEHKIAPINSYNIGEEVFENYTLSGYKFAHEGAKSNRLKPIKYSTDLQSILSKASHAILVKTT
jgi:hypothetical protein